MPVAAIEEPRPVHRVRFCPSAASELFWLLLYLMRAKRLPEDHPAALLAARHPDLRERIVGFWDDDGEGGFTELFVLAQRADTLFDSDVAPFVARLDEAGVDHVVHSEVSVYFTDPDGARVELIADPLGEMYGHRVL